MTELQTRELPLRKVVLFSSGVGYLERRGEVDGPARIELAFDEDDVSDVLKSLTIIDPACVNPSVAYPTEDGLDAMLRGLKPDLSGNPGLPDLMNAVRGVRIEVETSDGKVAGQVLGAEWRPGGDEAPKAYLSLVDDGETSVIPVEAILSYRLLDAAVARDFGRALDVLKTAATGNQRCLEVRLPADKKREVAMAYVTEAPVWKVSYRLDLGATPPLLQGWAIIDNASDVDWDDVELSLFVGRPSSFKQPLYETYHVEREEIPLAIAGSAEARVYDGAFDFAVAGAAQEMMMDKAPKPTMGRMRSAAPMALMSAAAPPVVATGRPVGEQFMFTLPDKVTLARRQSAMVPLVQGGLEVRKVSIVAGDDISGTPSSPALGLRIANKTGQPLPAGPITVFDDGCYGGDALVDFLAVGAERLLSYGDDLAVRVVRDLSQTQQVATAVLSGGVMKVKVAQLTRTDYRFTNESAARHVWLEHPRGQGEELVTPAKADETTAGDYRFEVPLPPGKTTFTVEVRSHITETISIADGRADALLHAAGRLPARVRAVIEKAAAIKQRQSKAEAELASLDSTEAKLVADQTRVRETLAVVGVGTRSGANYQKRLDELEDRLVALSSRQEALRKEADAAAAELSEYLAGQDFSEEV